MPKNTSDYFSRTVEPEIKKQLFKDKMIILYGPRQAGKTTLVKKLLNNYPKLNSLYINCDELDYRQQLDEAGTSTQLKKIIGDHQLVVIDEGQRVKEIGIKLKLIADNYPEQQIIATGSSSFELANQINEPLTGRAIDFHLYPLTLSEIGFQSKIEADRNLESLLIYGSYPNVISSTSLTDKEMIISSIAEKYLYKDILQLQAIKNDEFLIKVLQALALQITNEVSYNELASLLGVAKETVMSYIRLLEQAFIIFKLPPFSRNLRNELGKLRKIYFWDLGIRNALIRNFNPLSLRNDRGALWENFAVAQMIKIAQSKKMGADYYFWRTYQKQEIDLIESKKGKIFAYEIKWTKKMVNPPKAWQDAYSDSQWQVINRENYFDLFGKTQDF